jgi:hypothetical protein
MAVLFNLNTDATSLAEMVQREDFQFGLVALLAIVLPTQFLLMIQTILGRGVLSRLLLGTYRRPREVERFFMFLDLRGSTTSSTATSTRQRISPERKSISTPVMAPYSPGPPAPGARRPVA